MSYTTASTHRIDPASQVTPEDHHPRVVEMTTTPMCWGVLDYFINTVVLTVAAAMIGPAQSVAFTLKNAQTVLFIRTFLENTRIQTPAVLVALVYLDRVRHHLEIDTEDWVCERIALGALITAFKYINDVGVKADLWARCSGVFSKSDINRIEREFLYLLNFDLRVSEADMLAHYDGLMRLVHRPAPVPLSARRTRAEYHYPIHPHPPTARASPDAAPCALPDLTYPGTPDSHDTPPVITPPDAHALRGPAKLGLTTPSSTRNPYLARPRSRSPARRASPRRHSPYAVRRDAEMEARIRWYSVPDPGADAYGPRADSPRFEPFSPPTARYEPPRREQRAAYPPWRRGDDVWDQCVLFKI